MKHMRNRFNTLVAGCLLCAIGAVPESGCDIMPGSEGLQVVEAAPALVTVAGTVRDEAGKPLIGAVVALLVYIIGFPSFVGWNLFSHRTLVMEDQLLRAKGVGDDRLTNPHAYLFRKRFSRIYYQFRPQYFWWAEAIMLRKFMIAISTLIFNQSPVFQLAASELVLFLAFAAQVRNNPYMTSEWLDHDSLFILLRQSRPLYSCTCSFVILIYLHWPIVCCRRDF